MTLWQLEKLIRVRVLRLFSFIPRNWQQTTLLGRSEWLELGKEGILLSLSVTTSVLHYFKFVF